MKSLPCLTLMVLLLSSPVDLRAQDEAPVIVVAGTGQVELEPDYATLSFGVSVRDSTPSGALAEMNARLVAVSSALADLDLPWDSIPNLRFSLRPVQDSNQPGRPIIGYTASTTVSAEVRDFEQLPQLIDEALGAGANTINGISFGSDEMEAARDEALREAVREARRKAEIMASALGRELDEIIEVSTPEGASGFRAASMVVSAMRRTRNAAITPPKIEVTQRVSVRWRLTARAR